MDTNRNDPKIKHQIEKLEEVLEKLALKISQLETSEVDLMNDVEDSAYIKVARYKERFTEVHQKLCKLKGEYPPSDLANGCIKFAGTKIPALNRAIERFYNTNKEFPNFSDIVEVVKLINNKKKLELSEIEVLQTAKTAFKELGSIIKQRRQYDLNNVISSYLSVEEGINGDPANDDNELREKLDRNSELYGHRLDEVIDEFAKKQMECEANGE